MKLSKIFFLISLLLILPASGSCLSPVEQGVSFVNIQDGAKVKSPVKVGMQVIGKTLAPAGDLTPNSGHHHIIINGSPIEEGKVVPADATHLHFGKAQTEAELKLEKGKHTLTLQFGDKNHISYGKDWSQTISVEVTE